MLLINNLLRFKIVGKSCRSANKYRRALQDAPKTTDAAIYAEQARNVSKSLFCHRDCLASMCIEPSNIRL